MNIRDRIWDTSDGRRIPDWLDELVGWVGTFGAIAFIVLILWGIAR